MLTLHSFWKIPIVVTIFSSRVSWSVWQRGQWLVMGGSSLLLRSVDLLRYLSSFLWICQGICLLFIRFVKVFFPFLCGFVKIFVYFSVDLSRYLSSILWICQGILLLLCGYVKIFVCLLFCGFVKIFVFFSLEFSTLKSVKAIHQSQNYRKDFSKLLLYQKQIPGHFMTFWCSPFQAGPWTPEATVEHPEAVGRLHNNALLSVIACV